MPYVSSSGRKFRVDGPGIRLEQRAKPLLLVSAVLLCFMAVVRQGVAAAATLVAPASIQASRRAAPRVDVAAATPRDSMELLASRREASRFELDAAPNATNATRAAPIGEMVEDAAADEPLRNMSANESEARISTQSV